MLSLPASAPALTAPTCRRSWSPGIQDEAEAHLVLAVPREAGRGGQCEDQEVRVWRRSGLAGRPRMLRPQVLRSVPQQAGWRPRASNHHEAPARQSGHHPPLGTTPWSPPSAATALPLVWPGAPRTKAGRRSKHIQHSTRVRPSPATLSGPAKPANTTGD